MSLFKLDVESLNLVLDQPFTIARGTKKKVANVLVQLSDGTYTGYGEAAPNARYDEDAERVKAFIRKLPSSFFDDIDRPETLTKRLDAISPAVQAAKVAVEMAWLDWWAKSRRQPLWKIWAAPDPTGPVTSFTIGLDTIAGMQEKVRNAQQYPVYKVKLGTDRDQAIIKALRAVTDKPIRVDANEGWTTLVEAQKQLEFLADYDIQFVEQPMPAGQVEDLKKLKAKSPLPLCADESFMGHEPLEEIGQAFHMINIKLMKMSSLVKARNVIADARKNGLQVMIGCMIESSIANTAGALLSLWADHADLDGHLLIKDDPFEGLVLNENKQIILPDWPGIGVQPK